MFKSAVPFAFVLASLLPACAPAAARGTQASFGEITAAEIEKTSATHAYDVVRQLRPRWLRQRGASTMNRPTPLAVYVDNVRLGGPEALRQVPTVTIERIQFLDSDDATQRFGTGHVNGAILVFTR